MIKPLNLLLSAVCCMLLTFVATAQVLPDWLKQVSEQKHQKPEQMYALLQQHRDKFDKLDTALKAQWLYEEAVLHSALGRHQQQKEAAEKGLALLSQQQSVLRVQLLYELGFALEMQSDYKQAMIHYQSGTSLAVRLENEKQQLFGLINQAAILNVYNQGQQAMMVLRDVYSRARQLQDKELLAEVNAELGLLYASLAYEQEAIELLDKALQLYKELGWQKNLVTVLYNLARTYSYLGQYELALQTYHQMLRQSQLTQDKTNLYYAYLGLSITSSASGDSETALAYMKKAEEYLAEFQSKSHLSTHYYEKALIYQRLNQPSMAMQQVMLSEQAMDNEGITADSPTRANVLYLKATLLAEQGQFEKAYRQLHDFVLAFQQSRDKENELAIEQMRLSFNHEQQLQHNRLLEQDNELKALRLTQAERERQIQILWLVILGCSTLVLTIILIWQYSRRKLQRQTLEQ